MSAAPVHNADGTVNADALVAGLWEQIGPDEMIVIRPAIVAAHPRSPTVTVMRSPQAGLDDMRVYVKLNGGLTEAQGWFATEQARRIGQALIDQADAVDAIRAGAAR